jgi:hypothetical protein
MGDRSVVTPQGGERRNAMGTLLNPYLNFRGQTREAMHRY